MDSLGDHALFFSRGRSRNRAHNAVARALQAFARETNLEVESETVAPACLRGAQARKPPKKHASMFICGGPPHPIEEGGLT